MCLQTCKNLIDRAFVACDSGIFKAQAQCLGVMGELGNVYHHARDVLDRINPERWAGARSPPQTQQQQQLMLPGLTDRRKRQAPTGFGDMIPPQRQKRFLVRPEVIACGADLSFTADVLFFVNARSPRCVGRPA